MSLMSIKNFKHKALFLVLLFLMLSVLTGSIRQLYVNYHTKSIIKQKQKELKALEEKNKALKVRLEEVQTPKFLDEQARKLLGLGDASLSAVPILPMEEPDLEAAKEEAKPKELSNFQKWRELFGF
jgi:cell division protein FtsB